jgi:hypothetical protein
VISRSRQKSSTSRERLVPHEGRPFPLATRPSAPRPNSQAISLILRIGETLFAPTSAQQTSRWWFATGAEYGSGLPFKFSGDAAEAVATYGQAVIDRLNFVRGRVKPSFSVNASVGADLHKKESRSLTLQADVASLNNRLNVIDLGGLFSGNAIGPPRSYFLRLTATF